MDEEKWEKDAYDPPLGLFFKPLYRYKAKGTEQRREADCLYSDPFSNG